VLDREGAAEERHAGTAQALQHELEAARQHTATLHAEAAASEAAQAAERGEERQQAQRAVAELTAQLEAAQAERAVAQASADEHLGRVEQLQAEHLSSTRCGGRCVLFGGRVD
jgi:hypothetical protein